MKHTKGDKARTRLVESMLELIQARGYAGTGLNAVIEHAGTPKGSLYFHFPQGKEALGEQAVALAEGRFKNLIDEAARETSAPGDLVVRAVDVLATMLTDSDFQLGCPISVVTLEMGADSERLRAACEAAFESWITALADYLACNGYPAGAARALATTMVSTVEGAIIVSRASRSVEPLRQAAQVLAAILNNGTATTIEEGSAQ